MAQIKLKPSTLTAILLIAVVLAAIGSLLGTLAVPPGTEAGTVYETPLPIADFTLTDQKNQPFTFSSTQGKVVIMAFLFTHCGDVCPFSAIKMRQALEQLGDQASNVELVVVSTDPERDTVERLASYSHDLGMDELWHYVTGSVPDLQKVYKDLKITVIKSEEEEVLETVKSASELGISPSAKDQADSPLYGLTDQQVAEGGGVARKYAGGYNIAHSAPFWIVDTEGNLRTSLDVTATPGQIVEAVKPYLKKN